MPPPAGPPAGRTNYYLSPWVGSGTATAPFRPAVADAAPYEAIDLRPDPTKRAGWCFVATSIRPTLLPPGVISLGDVNTELPDAFVAELSAALGVDIEATMRFDRVRSPINIVLHLLAHEGRPDKSRWNPLATRPTTLPGGRRGELWELRFGDTYVRELAAADGPGAMLADNFDKANATTLGPGLVWTEIAGDWSVSSNQAACSTTFSAQVRAESDLGSTNHYAQADVAVLSTAATDAAAGVATRYSATANTCYLGEVNSAGNTMQVGKLVSGAYTQLAIASVSFDAPGTLRLESNGSTHTLLWGGTARVTVTDTAITSGLRTGMSGYNPSSGTRWDNFGAGDLAPNPAISTLLDGFNDGTIDPALWEVVGTGAVAETAGGRLRSTPPSDGNYSGLRSKIAYDLSAGSASVEVPVVFNGGAGAFNNQLHLVASANNELLIYTDFGNLKCDKLVNGTYTGTAVAYDPVAHRWWRIREASGTTFWETSPDRSVWTVRRQEANPLPVGGLKVLLDVGHYAGTGAASNPSFGEFDNLNRVNATFTIAISASMGPAGTVSRSGLRRSLAASVTPAGATFRTSQRRSLTASVAPVAQQVARARRSVTASLAPAAQQTAAVRKSLTASVAPAAIETKRALRSLTASVAPQSSHGPRKFGRRLSRSLALAGQLAQQVRHRVFGRSGTAVVVIRTAAEAEVVIREGSSDMLTEALSGARLIPEVSFRVAGVLADPDTVRFYVRGPDGVLMTAEYNASPNVVRLERGRYMLAFTATLPGTWSVRAEGTGGVEAPGEALIAIRPSAVL